MTDFPEHTLVVVADGTRAQFHRNRASDGDLELEPCGALLPQRLDDDGPAGKRPPESTQQETDEATFAKQLAEDLYERARRDEFEALVLAADPQTLGQIRPSLHQTVRERLVKEVDKTLTNSSIEEIERSLR